MIERWTHHVINGTGYALIIWGLASIFGSPAWTHHHLTFCIVWTGLAYALGSSAGWNDVVHLARRRLSARK